VVACLDRKGAVFAKRFDCHFGLSCILVTLSLDKLIAFDDIFFVNSDGVFFY